MAGTFYNRLTNRWKSGAYVCVGLDIDNEKLPTSLEHHVNAGDRVFNFAKDIIDATVPVACAFKLNSAHFEAMGPGGQEVLARVISYAKQAYPDVPVILDAKRGDIGDTNEYYARAVFDELGADAVTVHPYMGRTSLTPFLRRVDKGVIVMGVNSAEGAEEIQSLLVAGSNETFAEYICRRVATRWNTHENCSVTASALDARSLARVRHVAGDMPILLLGVGAQGGNVAECVAAGRASSDLGLIINSSRAILYASSGDDYAAAAAQAAEQLNDSIAVALGR